MDVYKNDRVGSISHLAHWRNSENSQGNHILIQLWHISLVGDRQIPVSGVDSAAQGRDLTIPREQTRYD
jgi:hypothetical protein